jgi:hypothetical protein
MVSSIALSSATRLMSLKRGEFERSERTKVYALVMDNGCRANELVYLRISLSSQLCHVPFRLIDSESHSFSHMTTDISYGRESSHFNTDGGLSGVEIRLLCAQSLGIEGESMAK